jgi:hypothetical protein
MCLAPWHCCIQSFPYDHRRLLCFGKSTGRKNSNQCDGWPTTCLLFHPLFDNENTVHVPLLPTTIYNCIFTPLILFKSRHPAHSMSAHGRIETYSSIYTLTCVQMIKNDV